MPLGPVMCDVTGPELTTEDIRRLSHPLVGGVILFARNYQSPGQLTALTRGIRDIREPALPICVDHEGGRVQRFREGFTAIPPMRSVGERWNRSRSDGLDLARDIGFVIGHELASHGVDFSFAPVLDIDWGESGVIGHRAFHRDPSAVAMLGGALMRGLACAGVGNVGKHFPGHGYVRADSHLEVPLDEREFDAIWTQDLVPFRELSNGTMTGVMPAHVIYPRVDPNPAGFSRLWLQDVLRGRLGFDGLIFSDDLSMEGAAVAGNVTQRGLAALDAGCDVILLCNDPSKADELLDGLARAGVSPDPRMARRLERMRANTVDAQFAAALANVRQAGDA
ncbi:MAG TPA: beta-N-acetylhexosaminidase [Usitatibacteraceae bacterium]|nr:beta-N-acetylhexosaminidase [Usitatibacteraceae bacterium]